MSQGIAVECEIAIAKIFGWQMVVLDCLLLHAERLLEIGRYIQYDRLFNWADKVRKLCTLKSCTIDDTDLQDMVVPIRITSMVSLGNRINYAPRVEFGNLLHIVITYKLQRGDRLGQIMFKLRQAHHIHS